IKGNPGAGYSNERVNDHRFGWVACLEWMATRPAQTEQQATLWARQCDLDEPDPAIFVAREQVEESGYVVPFYAAPIAQTAPQSGKVIAYRTLDRHGNAVTDWIAVDPANGEPIVTGGSFQLAYAAPQ